MNTRNTQIFLAFISAVFLAGYLNIDCGKRCNYMLQMSCGFETHKTNDSDCCHSKQSKNSSPDKCKGKGSCCINNLPPAATIDGQSVGFDNQIIPVISGSSVLTESNFNLQVAIFSTGPPFRLSNSTQSVLCVFVI